MNPLLLVGSIIGFVATIFLVFVLLSVFSESTSPVPSVVYAIFKDILGPVAAGFGGALLGAFATYAMQSNVERRKEKISAVNAYNKGMTVLLVKYKDLWTLKQQVIVPCQDLPLRFLRIPRFQEFLPNSESATDSLNQIIISAGIGDLLSKLMIAEKKYIAALASFRERNDMVLQYMTELDTHFSKTKGRQTPSLSDLVEIHSHTRLLRLYDFSESVIRNLDDAITYLHDLIVKLGEKLPSQIKFQKNPLIEINLEKPEQTPMPHYRTIDELSAALEAAVTTRKA